MAEPIKTWRYHLQSETGQGWAEIVLCSSGFFGAVSDYGNYSFAWRGFGDGDFRAFVAQLDAGYLMSKLGPQSGHRDEFDAEKSLRSIREHIIEARHDGSLTKEQAREERRLSELLEDEPSLIGATHWHDQTKIEDAHELLCNSPSAHLVIFCEKTMPRLAAVLRAELEAERAQEAAIAAGEAPARYPPTEVLADSDECDECDGSGVYYINGEPQKCICTEPQTDDAAPVCATCLDTHRMRLGEREVPCTRCPTPCEKCRSGAYCKAAPCDCECHKRAEVSHG